MNHTIKPYTTKFHLKRGVGGVNAGHTTTDINIGPQNKVRGMLFPQLTD